MKIRFNYKALRKLGLALSVVICAFATASAVHAQAVTPAASPCDPNYYDSLEARAWLEAQREVTQNQNLIFKPDSVLEYTCFDKQLDLLSDNASNMFSESVSLDSIAGTPASNYINANFSHSYLGGRNSSISESSSTCNIMKQVWEKSKCMNFISNASNDGFFTFAQYMNSADKRYLPSPSCSESRWQQEYNNALVDANTPWQEDNVKTYFNLLDPGACGDSSSPPIATGLTVKRSQTPTEYAEKVCLAPGCVYVPTSSTAGSCQPSS